MASVEDFIVETKTKLMVQQGQIEILMGLVTSKFGKEELMEYVRFVATHSGFGREAKYAAIELLRKETPWTTAEDDNRKL